METLTPITKRFMTKYERHEPAVRDSTAIRAAKTCKRLYFYTMVLGFRKKDTKPYFAFGTCYHKFREVLERTQELKPALDATLELWKKIGSNPPVGTKWDFLTGKRLLASCMCAFEWWQKEKTLGRVKVIASEQPFQVLLSDNKTVIGGRADQIVMWGGKLWGRDFKTASKMGEFYDRTLEPNDQFTRYTLGETKLQGAKVEGQLIEVMYNTSKEGPKIVPLVTSRTDWQLQEWEQDQIFYERILQLCREEDRWPMEEINCPFCDFRSVCKAPNELSMMHQLDSNFVQQAWNFYNVGEE